MSQAASLVLSMVASCVLTRRNFRRRILVSLLSPIPWPEIEPLQVREAARSH
jgi:hypothetical protein